MSFPRISNFYLIPGRRCTMTCDHCSNDSGPAQKFDEMDKNEMDLVVAEILRLRPKQITVTGGEPTLYTHEISGILSQLNFEFDLLFTTNGFFATSLERVIETFKPFDKITAIQMSFDRFHNRSLESKSPLFLSEYCHQRSIAFNLSVCLSDPLDVIWAANAERVYGVDVIFQKVEGSGRARIKNAEYQYTIFENEVLKMNCPNSSTVSYIAGRGFSPCCSNLVFNSKAEVYLWKSIREMQMDPVYSELVNLTMLERIEKHGVKFDFFEPRLSSPCNLCEQIEKLKCGRMK